MKDISINQNNAEAAETQRTQSLNIWVFLCVLCVSAASALYWVSQISHVFKMARN